MQAQMLDARFIQIGNALKAVSEPRVVVIQDCGHYVPEEQPAETIKYIRAAIGS